MKEIVLGREKGNIIKMGNECVAFYEALLGYGLAVLVGTLGGAAVICFIDKWHK